MTRDQWVALAYGISYWLMGAFGMVAGIVLERVYGRPK